MLAANDNGLILEDMNVSFRIENESWGYEVVRDLRCLPDWLAELPAGQSTAVWYRDAHTGMVERTSFPLFFPPGASKADRTEQFERRVGQAMERWIVNDLDAVVGGVDVAGVCRLIRGTVHATVLYYGLLNTLADIEAATDIRTATNIPLVAAVAAARATPCSCCANLPAWLMEFCLGAGLNYVAVKRCVSA